MSLYGSRKTCQGIKFGSLAVYITTAKLKPLIPANISGYMVNIYNFHQN